MTAAKKHPASYRDPAGFVFEKEGTIYRQVNQSYAAHYSLLKNSGLYDLLVRENKLIPHTEIDACYTSHSGWYKTLLPEQLHFISYPYEWCFSQWKDAALLTLSIVQTAIRHGMILKDATPFNVQFVKGVPVFIDTLSFEKYDVSKPWIAYRQFVECFIAPLLLARYQSPGLMPVCQLYPDGIPIKTVAGLLPLKTMFSLNVLMHIFLPSIVSGSKTNVKPTAAFNRQKLLHIIGNLESFVKSLRLSKAKTSWNNYYEQTILSNEYLEEKKKILQEWLRTEPAKTVLDMGTNTGLFAQMAAAENKFTIAVDSDIDCIDRLYNNCRRDKINNLLPLYINISNPSPSLGWDNLERTSFLKRAKTDLCLALALVHHLVIGKNIGFLQLATVFSEIAPCLIIEFVPKTDPKVELLLQNREDIFPDYNELSFIEAFKKIYSIEKREVFAASGRILFLMKRKTPAVQL